MKPAEFYAQLLKQLDAGIERKVFDVFTSHMDAALTREFLIAMVFGIMDVQHKELSASPEDRKIRKCIEGLRMKGIPIIASSGESGYTLIGDPDRIEGYIAEERARITKLQGKIKMLYSARKTAKNLRLWREAFIVPFQEKMF